MRKASLFFMAALLGLALNAQAKRPLKVFHLYSNDGIWKMADGKTSYIVGYVAYNDKFEEAPQGATLPAASLPSPTLRVTEGDEVEVHLHNAGHTHAEANSGIRPVPHTIHFHGMDLLKDMDGVPNLPLKPVAPGEEYTYKFVADHEGTYLYHCHVDSATHILLGMYGALIVDAKRPNTIYGHHFDREYTLLFSELDTKHNNAIGKLGFYNMLNWKSDYFLLNGRIFVEDLDNPLSIINDPRSVIKCREGETVLLRLMAIGFEHTFAFHPHAYHMQVIGTDGRGLDSPYWKDTLPIVSGERYDVLVPIQNKAGKMCESCRYGRGISIAHDHNLGGQVSGGFYPQGPLTIFMVEDTESGEGLPAKVLP